MPFGSDQTRGRATRRAVARANQLVAESKLLRESDLQDIWRRQGFSSFTRWPVPVRKDWGAHVLGLPAEAEDGNPGECSGESPEVLTTGQDCP